MKMLDGDWDRMRNHDMTIKLTDVYRHMFEREPASGALDVLKAAESSALIRSRQAALAVVLTARVAHAMEVQP